MAFYLAELLVIMLLWPLLGFNLKLASGKIVQRKDVFLGSAFLILFATMAFRGRTVGSDTSVYMDIFDKIANAGSFGDALSVSTIASAPLYVAIHYAVSRFVTFTQISVFINSAIIAIGFFSYIRKESLNYPTSVFLLYALTLYFESMNGTRQFMAIVIALNAYSLLKTDIRSKKGWVLFLIAIGFHNTILAFGLAIIAVMFKDRINSSEKVLIYTVGVAVVFTVSFAALINIAVAIFPYFNTYLNGENSTQFFGNGGNGRIALLFVFLVALIFGWYVLTKNKAAAHSTDYTDLITCLFGGVVGIIFSRNILFVRVLWPFMCVYIVLIPNLLHSIPPKARKALYFLIVVVLLTYSSLFLREDKSGIIPYIPFWVQ